MTRLKKNLKYYLNLPYKIEIEPILEKEGGGYLAKLPQFGAMGITGDGETIEEALKMLEQFKTIQFKRFIDQKRDIPEPQEEKQLNDFSGRILVRIPKELHQSMATNATNNGVSQNQYINYLLTKALGVTDTDNMVKSENRMKTVVKQTITETLFEIENKQQYRLNEIIKPKRKKPLLSGQIYPDDYMAA